jgi:16S rRNA (uracil1498-N3)-methyltransferase
MRRFYCPHADFSCETILFSDSKEIHHLVNVLRHKEKDKIIVFNGRSEEAQVQLISVSPKEVKLQILSKRKMKSNLPQIILLCAIPKKGKFETIIEKATELGVAEIIPLKTQRSEVELKEKRLEQKISRYQQVAVNAAKQSQRQTVPVIHSVMKFSSALEELKERSTMLIPSLMGNREPIVTTLTKISSDQPICIFIGPEGDFTPAEYELAFQKGCRAVSLGASVLKVETAALCALSCVTQFFNHAHPTK